MFYQMFPESFRSMEAGTARLAAAAVVAAAVIVVAAAAAVAAHEEQQNQNDDPPAAIAIVSAHCQALLLMNVVVRSTASGSRCVFGERRVPLPSLMICRRAVCVTDFFW